MLVKLMILAKTWRYSNYGHFISLILNGTMNKEYIFCQRALHLQSLHFLHKDLVPLFGMQLSLFSTDLFSLK